MGTLQTAPQLTSIEVDQLCIDTIRTLSIDAVRQVKSGHPGTQWRWRRWWGSNQTAY